MNIILFDGECSLCNNTVRFIIKHDRKAVFRFASLQSGIGQQLSKPVATSGQDLSTVIYIENGKYYTRSTAILRIIKKMRGFWQLGYALIIIPPFIRNFFYMLISTTRHKIFGKTTICKIPPAEMRERFIDRIL